MAPTYKQKAHRNKLKKSVFNKGYKPQSESLKCWNCGVQFSEKPLVILWRDCCECGKCGRFMIMDEKILRVIKWKL